VRRNGRKAKQRDGYRSALRSRDLRRLLASQLISSTGSWAYSVALAVLLFERTHSTAWVAAGALGRFVPSLLFSAYGGVIAERLERITLMVRVNVLALVAQLGLALLAWRDGPLALAIVLAACTSLLMVVYNPAVAAVIPQVTREDDLAAANALNGSIDNLVIILGPAVGAALLVLGGTALAILVNAISFGVAAVIVSTLSVRSRPSDVTEGGRAGPMRQIADGFRALTSSSTAAVFVAFSVLASFVYGTDTVLFVPISLQLNTGATGYGYLLAGLGVGGVAGAAAVSRLARNRRLAPAILGGMAFYCLPTAVLVLVHQPAVAFVLQVVRGAGTLVVDTLAITALQRSAPREMVARVFGVFFALVLAAISLGALITPAVLGKTGLHTTLLIYGLGIPALCLLTLPRLLAMDRVAAAAAAKLAPRIAILERLDLFAAASRASMEQLAGAASEERVAAGTPVVVEGGVSDAFYAVVEGELEVSAVGERRGPHRLATLGPGTYFGEIGLIRHIPRIATVTASTACTLLRIDGQDFLDALTNLSASPSLLEGVRTRLALTHPSKTALLEVESRADSAVVAVPAAE
jgi:CRP-like cAMP-binding protein/predicted MFS family arabinose efflux permease